MTRKSEWTPLLWMGIVGALVLGILALLLTIFSYSPKVFKNPVPRAAPASPSVTAATPSPGGADTLVSPASGTPPDAAAAETGYLVVSVKVGAQALRNGVGRTESTLTIDGISPDCPGRVVELTTQGMRFAQTQFTDEPVSLKLEETLCFPAKASVREAVITGTDALRIEGLAGSPKIKNSGLSLNLPTAKGYAQISLWALSADFCDAEVSCEDVGNANAWVAYSVMNTRQLLNEDNRVTTLRDAYETSRLIHLQQTTVLLQ